MKRRDFLRYGAVGTAAIAWSGCGGSSSGAGMADAGRGPDGATGAGDGGATCQPTESDALGPFFEEGAPMRTTIAGQAEPGERLTLTGRIVETDCETPVPGVLVDVWQADQAGAYYDAGADYRLRGQVQTGADGTFTIETIRPGHYENGPGNWRPAHVHFMFASAGFAGFATQIYFAGDPYLQPNDGCGSCGSDDPKRIVDLSGDADAGWQGAFRIVLARS